MKKLILFLVLIVPLLLQAQVRVDQIRAVDSSNNNVPVNRFIGSNGSGKSQWVELEASMIKYLPEFVEAHSGGGANEATIHLSGTTPTWNTDIALNADIESVGTTTVTMSGLVDGREGYLWFQNGGGHGISFITPGFIQVFAPGIPPLSSNINSSAGSVTIIEYKVKGDSVLFMYNEKKKPKQLLVWLSPANGSLETGIKSPLRFETPITITEFRIEIVGTNPSSTGITVDVNEDGVSILSNKITVDLGDSTSRTADVSYTISDSSIAAFSTLDFEVDVADGAGVQLWMKYYED